MLSYDNVTSLKEFFHTMKEHTSYSLFHKKFVNAISRERSELATGNIVGHRKEIKQPSTYSSTLEVLQWVGNCHRG